MELGFDLECGMLNFWNFKVITNMSQYNKIKSKRSTYQQWHIFKAIPDMAIIPPVFGILMEGMRPSTLHHMETEEDHSTPNLVTISLLASLQK